MEKFSNVDILAALDAIMRQNTGFYQDQFQNDRQTITEAAASPAKDDKTLLWVSAPAGTCCETEKSTASCSARQRIRRIRKQSSITKKPPGYLPNTDVPGGSFCFSRNREQIIEFRIPFSLPMC